MTRMVGILLVAFLSYDPPLEAGDLPPADANPRACIGCHGPNGNSPHPKAPSIAGQTPEYIEAQIKAYRDGKRTNPVMGIIARGLSDTDSAQLARYFSDRRPMNTRTTIPPAPQPELLETCSECHGDTGQGAGHSPRIAGQQPRYAFQQLLHYKSGLRSQPEMSALLQSLQAEEMQALADYLAALP